MEETQSLQALKPRLRRVSLAFMGEEWKDAYVDLRYLTWADTKNIRERASQAEQSDDAIIGQMIETVSGFIAGGKVLNPDGELIDLASEMVVSFDLDAIQVLYQRLMGVPDPNASSPSTAS